MPGFTKAAKRLHPNRPSHEVQQSACSKECSDVSAALMQSGLRQPNQHASSWQQMHLHAHAEQSTEHLQFEAKHQQRASTRFRSADSSKQGVMNGQEGPLQQAGFASPPATPGGFSIASPAEPPFSVHRLPANRTSDMAWRHDGTLPITQAPCHTWSQCGAKLGVVVDQQRQTVSPFMQRVASQMQRDAAVLAAHADIQHARAGADMTRDIQQLVS